MDLFNLSISMPSLSTRVILCLLEEEGHDINPILKEIGLTPEHLSDSNMLVRGEQELALQRAFAGLTAHDMDLWVTLGLRYRTFTFYPLGFAQMTAATLRDALALVRRYSPLVYTPGVIAEIPEQDGVCGISVSYDKSLSDILDFLRCRDLTGLIGWFNELWRGSFPFSSIETSQAIATHPKFAGCADRIIYGEHNKLYWPAELMDMAPRDADPAMHETYVAHCEAILRSGEGKNHVGSEAQDSLLERIEIILSRPGNLGISLDKLASEMGMSRRSLQRSLANRDTSFRQVIDGRRRGVAHSLLMREHQSIAEVAWLLGYKDSASFHQAFNRWNAMSPGEFRRQQNISRK